MILNKEQLAVMMKGDCTINTIPEKWTQRGGTCGIYALDGAFKMRGHHAAVPRRSDVDGPYTTSLRQIAKKMNVTKIGELNDVEHISTLAMQTGYSAGEVKTFTNADELWAIVTMAIKNKGAVVMPFLCRDDTGDLSQSGGFAHYCLLFGFGKQFSVRQVYAANYGLYQLWSIESLLESNFAIRDWEKQQWTKVMLWIKGANEKDFSPYRPEWISQSDMHESLDAYATAYNEAHFQLGIETKDATVHEWKPGPQHKSKNQQTAAKMCVMKSTTIPQADMTKTMKGKCFVV